MQVLPIIIISCHSEFGPCVLLWVMDTLFMFFYLLRFPDHRSTTSSDDPWVSVDCAVCEGLQCYQCTNFEILSDPSGLLSGLRGKSDPSCGANPFNSNTVQCGGGQVCGSVSAQVSANTCEPLHTHDTHISSMVSHK